MEGVGARLGRSSTRYGGPTTVFNGPVRKWKKKWVHVSPPSSSNNNNSNHNSSGLHHYLPTPNAAVNGNNGTNVVLYKWTPIPSSAADDTSPDKKLVKDASSSQHPDLDNAPTRRVKYIPIAALEEQKEDAGEQVEDDAQEDETDLNVTESTQKLHDSDEKPDINDVPMEESQAADKSRVKRQDLNESTLDLSLG